MNYLFLLIGFSNFIICSFFIGKFLPEYLKRYAFISTISLISTALYLLTFNMNYFYVQYGIYALSAAVLITEAVKDRCHSLKDFCHAHRLIFIFSFLWFLVTFKVQILQWDDFSWGSFVKHLNFAGTYWDSKAAVLPIAWRYFPGLSLWETFFTGQGHYSEQALFFSLGLICICCFYSLRPSWFNKKQTAWLFLAFCAPLSWFTNGLGNISTEASIAYLLATAIISTFDIKRPEELFVPFTIAIFMAITKETAFTLSLLIILLITIKSLRTKNFFSKWMIFSLITLFIIALNYSLWQWHLHLDPIVVNYMKNFPIAEKMASDFASFSDRSKETLIIFFKALYDRPITRSFLSRLPIPGFIYIKGFYLFWVLILGIILYQVREKYEYTTTFFWGLLGYTSVLVISFLYFFGEYEGKQLASYERYIGVYFLAFSLVSIKIILDKKLWLDKRFKIGMITMFVIFPPSPKILYPLSIKNLIPEAIAKRLPMKIDGTRQEVELIRSKIEELTPADSNIWLIWQNSNGQQAMIVRYEIAPRKMNEALWSFGKPYYDGDVWTADIDLEEVSGNFSKTDYVALGFIDEKFVQKYGPIFTTPPKSGAVYKKIITNNQLRLQEVHQRDQ